MTSKEKKNLRRQIGGANIDKIIKEYENIQRNVKNMKTDKIRNSLSELPSK